MPRDRENPLQIRLKINRLPKSVGPEAAFKRMLQAIDNREPLPQGWDVQVIWRNPQSHGYSGGWNPEAFDDCVESSRDGFNDILAQLCQNNLNGIRRRKQQLELSKPRVRHRQQRPTSGRKDRGVV